MEFDLFAPQHRGKRNLIGGFVAWRLKWICKTRLIFMFDGN